MPILQDDQSSQSTFQRLKACCVPLMGNSQLTPASVASVSRLLSEVIAILHEVETSGQALRPSIISYVFFPLSTIMRRSTLSTIPDQILEKVFITLTSLCESWWWDLDEMTWEQLFMLCGAVLGGIDSKGKGKIRDDESREAATRCLSALLRERSPDEDPLGIAHPPRCNSIFTRFQAHSRTKSFVPILGQTVNSLLITSESPHLPLQRGTLQVLLILIDAYLPEDIVPSVLPGTVSTTSKIALGVGIHKGWANGDIVAAALTVMQAIIVHSVGDVVCAKHGAVRGLSLDDLVDEQAAAVTDTSPASVSSPYATTRTASWLHATASQLHIAMNALTPLVNHPSPTATLALITFSETVLSETTLTVPQSQGLLTSFLLSLTNSPYDDVSDKSSRALRHLLSPTSSARYTLLKTILHISKDGLTALPRLITTHSDSKVEHLAGLIRSVCAIAQRGSTDRHGIAAISAGVGKLLGPMGGIEKWGWSLLSVFDLAEAPITVTGTDGAHRLLEASGDATVTPFPTLVLDNMSRSAQAALERMFHSMGAAAGDECSFAIEWFLAVGQNGRNPRAAAALWCACRLLEGVGRVKLDNVGSESLSLTLTRSKRLEKLVRGVARRVAESLSDVDDEEVRDSKPPEKDDENLLVEHVKGLLTIRSPVDSTSHATRPRQSIQPLLHKALSLQLLAITAGILEARFAPLLLHTLYPILHSVVSESPLVSTSGRATLDYVATSTSYASPANMLLANFDYALDAVSRRLGRRWLDVDATKVLVALIRLVGKDAVQKAGDVVEECFDRLDEYHGYEVIVDGLVGTLTEVVNVVKEDEETRVYRGSRLNQPDPVSDDDRLTAFFDWFANRNAGKEESRMPSRDDSYPRVAWGKPTNAEEDEAAAGTVPEPNLELAATPSQTLTKQIVSRSLYFLTHSSPTIRARILLLLSSAVPVLSESALLPSVHHAWPFILNRLGDREPFVVTAAAALTESLATHVGDFMYRRIWDDVWPRFRRMLDKLRAADATSALARRGPGAVGTESAYTHSHRLYRSMLRTMTAATAGVRGQDAAIWGAIVLFRRFLSSQAHEELQSEARHLYMAISVNNADAVWLALSATQGRLNGSMGFLSQPKWDIGKNAHAILGSEVGA